MADQDNIWGNRTPDQVKQVWAHLERWRTAQFMTPEMQQAFKARVQEVRADAIAREMSVDASHTGVARVKR